MNNNNNIDVKKMFDEMIKFDSPECLFFSLIKDKIIFTQNMGDNFDINKHMLLAVNLNTNLRVSRDERFRGLFNVIFYFIICGNNKNSNEIDGLFTKISNIRHVKIKNVKMENNNLVIYIKNINSNNIYTFILDINDIKDIYIIYDIISAPNDEFNTNLTCLLKVDFNDILKTQIYNFNENIESNYSEYKEFIKDDNVYIREEPAPDFINRNCHDVGSLNLDIPEPNNILTLTNGKQSANIDFGGDSVVYSGDLPVEESAKIFFNAVHQYFKGKII